jgi:opacity protein-like surface antigen
VSRWFLLALALLAPVSAAAQSAPSDPSENARFHFGGIRFTPFLAITEVGVDTNVYHEFEDPKRDTTATFGPGVDYWFRLGRARVAAKSDVTYTWFETYTDQRSFNTDHNVKLSLPLNRLTPFVDGELLRGRTRPSYEIDSRSFRTESAYGGGIDVRVTGKSIVRLEGHHRDLDFRADEFFIDTSLREALNRTSDSGALSFREALTPLTTLVVMTEYENQQFTYSSFKDAHGLRIMPGFELDPFALISGKVFVGYHRFNVLDPTVPDYQGLVANVEANYDTHATRVSLAVKRDVTYSYQTTEPYYLLSDITGQVIQKVTTRWDLMGRLGRQWLGYRQVELAGSSTMPREDRGYHVGGGVGYQLGENVRLGMNVDYYRRTSNQQQLREYDGVRVGGSFTYGLSRQ